MALELDVHGLMVNQAIHRIQRAIVENPKCNFIEIIHGFKHGSAVKKCLMNKANIHNKRVIKTHPVPFNEGRTFIYLDMI